MQLHHHGATDGVTGSCHALVLEGLRRAGDAPALVADPRQAIELISNSQFALIALLAW